MMTPIIILVLLTTPLLAESVMARIQQRCVRLEVAVLSGLIIAFIFFALGHFVKTEGMIAMLPAWFPFKSSVVYLTGAWEIMIAIALVLKPYRKAGLVLALVTLIIFFPINIHAAYNYMGMGGHQWGPVYLLIRGPLQLILIAWSIWALSFRQH